MLIQISKGKYYWRRFDPEINIFEARKGTTMSPDSAPYYFCGLGDHRRYGPPLFISFFAFTYVVPLFVIATMYLLIVRYQHDRKLPSSKSKNHDISA